MVAVEASGSRGNAGYAAFRAALLDGRLKPGGVLTQAELCETLGMSLSPLRDTLTLLEADGLVSIRHRAGITVVQPDVAFIRRNFQFRSIIEREALQQFAQLASPGWIEKTVSAHEEVLSRVEAHAGVEELEQCLRQLDWDFHTAIVDCLRNPMISETHFQIQENLRFARVLTEDFVSPFKVSDAVREHLRVLDRLAAHDAHGAIEAMLEHFRAATHRAFGS